MFIVKSISKALLTGFAISLVPVCVQANDIPLRGPIPFEAYDTNNSNSIDPQEFVAAYNTRRKMRKQAGMMDRPSRTPGFMYFDSNGDSQLSKEELTKGRESWRQQGAGQGQGQGMGRGQGMGSGRGMNRGRNMPSFSDFDLNGDGVLLKEEFYDARAKRMYQRADQGFPMRNAATAPSFETVDSNGDGKVSKDEFAAHQAEHMKSRQ